MRCEDFEVRLNDVLDERRTLASDAELAEHARRCGACGELARGYEELLAGLSHELPPAPAWLAERAVEEALYCTRAGMRQSAPAEDGPPGPSPDRVTAWEGHPTQSRKNASILPACGILKPSGDQSRPRFIERLPLFALAASVLIAAGVMWWNGSRQPMPNKLADEIALRAESTAQTAESARQTAETAPAVVSRVPGGTDDVKTDEVAGLLPGTDWAPAGAQWAQEVADGLRPVTRPTVGAISGFLNLWGISPEGHQS
ncbi:MAG TPA: hypothetical protein VF278_16785 [Pirellulales bacterium]